MKYNELTKEEQLIIEGKGTELPYEGKYATTMEEGTYICKRCNNPLFSSESKFNSGTGWPSFDDSFENAVKRALDKDGIRTEILCSNCGAHLGHVFEGENFTKKNVRNCANSISLNFIPRGQKLPEVLDGKP